jgi:hypothetical protein
MQKRVVMTGQAILIDASKREKMTEEIVNSVNQNSIHVGHLMNMDL